MTTTTVLNHAQIFSDSARERVNTTGQRRWGGGSATMAIKYTFEGGFPDPGTFPMEALSDVTRRVLMTDRTALNYDFVGYGGMRKVVIELERPHGGNLPTDENVLITAGASQALQLAYSALLNPGDSVILEESSYIAQQIRMWKPKVEVVPMDDDGACIVEMRQTLDSLRARNITPKFFYVVADFNNPLGLTYSLERRKQILAALAQMDKQFGKGSVLMLGSRAALPVEVISSGSIGIDNALGAGGFPRGRVVEIFGPESSGKTTLALHVIAEAQRAGGAAAFIDAEHALDPTYATRLGVDTENLIVSQPDYGEQALEIAQALVTTQAIDVIVIDSVAALTPKAEIEGEMGDSHMGLQARMMSQALRKLTASVSRANTCLVFINQLREKIGVMFGNPETTTGGRALKFYASIRVEVRRSTPIKDGETVVGNRTKIKIVKNKVAAPFRELEVDILYGKGISRESDVLDLGVQQGVFEKSGSWYSYKGERIGQGRENVRAFLKENKEITARMEAEVRKTLGIGAPEKAQSATAIPNGLAHPEPPVSHRPAVVRR